ncbi:hypothetical protein DNK47_01630 [Mycoplasma wenyonii]|uniref:Uncharacterized protein n=1 Tax=Mycoplasma wenyonii TaxID=65123 RepID=A0A328PVE8_9MOLU|nr:hypothetical protein [Mycoplasma wenyonii]RAO95089.1 hypothetical protein DNK47_01630 [Mycoplasma wenyonii]
MKSFLVNKEPTPKNKVRQRKRIFSKKGSERSIYKILSSCFKKRGYYLSQGPIFEKYKEQILAIAIFLSTTSPFLYKKKSEKLLNFHWRKYIQIFSKQDAVNFLDCSVLYLLENSHFSGEDEEEIKSYLPKPIISFNESYVLSIIKKNKEDNDLNLLGIRFDKYLNLIDLSLRLFEIIRYEVSKDCSKVLELVELSNTWKEKTSEIFGFKSEYIAFLYFLNLRSKRRKLTPWWLS